MNTTGRTDANDLFIALGHPIRRQILREMIRRRIELSPSELADDLDHSLSKLSYHVSILLDCGAIELVKTQPTRGSTQHFYRSALEAEWARKALRATAPGADGRRRGEEIG
jgi:DNA-binding transcriptional ArsR family regulator